MRVKRVRAYAGVDPTASSLHLGHLLTFMPLFWMYVHGYGATMLIGGFTAKIGDPTGRTDARPRITPAQLTQNLAGIHTQCKALWANVLDQSSRFGWRSEWAWQRAIVNNAQWWNKKPVLEIMRLVGSDLRLGPLLGRDNVKKRLQNGSGISFAEFCYPVLQGYDWCELFKQRNITMQIGGSDQYGNILTGVESVKAYVKNMNKHPATTLPDGVLNSPIGFTIPLLTDSSGAKFGKSAGNAIWLDPLQTSPFDLYGYLVRRPDDQVERLLKLFTFLSQTQIASAMAEHQQDPSRRVAQHLLAYEVSWLVHGVETARMTQEEHRARYRNKVGDPPVSPPVSPAAQSAYDYLPPHEGLVKANNRPRIDMKLPRSLLDQTLPRIVWAANFATSSSDANRKIKAGGIYLGGRPGQQGSRQTGMIIGQLSFQPAKTWDRDAVKKFIIDDNLMILRQGKHNLRIIEFIDDKEYEASGAEYPGMPYTGSFRRTVSKMNELLAGSKAKVDALSTGEETDASYEEVPSALVQDDKPDLDELLQTFDVAPKIKNSQHVRKYINAKKADGSARKGPWDDDA